jgi:hypothetical protein
MWNKKFWQEATDRAIRTVAQTVLVFIGLDGAQLLGLNWTVVGAAVGGAAVASFATSIVSASGGDGEISAIKPQNNMKN